MGEHALAVQHLSYAAKANPVLLSAVLGNGSALMSTGGGSAALAALRPAVESLSRYGNDNEYLLLALATWRSGNPQAALTAVNDVLGVNPGNKVAEIYKTRIEREGGARSVTSGEAATRSLTAESSYVKPFEGVLINGGAKATNNPSVTLGVYGELTQVAFSNDNSTWSSWFSKPSSYGEFAWELSRGDGQKTVSMRFRGFLGIGVPGQPGTITLIPPAVATRLTRTATGMQWTRQLTLQAYGASGCRSISSSGSGSIESEVRDNHPNGLPTAGFLSGRRRETTLWSRVPPTCSPSTPRLL